MEALNMQDVITLVGTPAGFTVLIIFLFGKMLQWTSTRLDDKDKFIRESLLEEIKRGHAVVEKNTDAMALFAKSQQDFAHMYEQERHENIAERKEIARVLRTVNQ